MTRDSVCAADDLDPHDSELKLPPATADLEQLVEHLHFQSNLPLIAGGRATWVLRSKGPIAVMAQEWKSPRLTIRQADLAASVEVSSGVARFHWAYRAQQDPGTVFNELRTFCDRCGELRVVVEIRSPSELLADGTLRCVSHLGKGLLPVRGDFEITADGPWDGVLQYTFACTECGTEFELDAETYHGSGGRWRPLERST